MIDASYFENKFLKTDMHTSYINKVPSSSTEKLNSTLSWAKRRSNEVLGKSIFKTLSVDLTKNSFFALFFQLKN